MVMEASTQRRSRRPDRQLYVPGRGLIAKNLQSDAVVIDDHQESSLRSNCDMRVKYRRPDIEVYVTRAKQNSLQSNETSSSLYADYPNVPEADNNVRKPNCCNASKESCEADIAEQFAKVEVTCAEDGNQIWISLTENSASWADQVEQYVSNSIYLEEDSEEKSRSSAERDLDLQSDHQDNVLSSGYSSSSNERLSYFEQEHGSDDEINLLYNVQEQNLQNKLQDKSTVSEQSLSASVQICKVASFPLKKTVVSKLKAKNKTVLRKLKVSTLVQHQNVACFPGKETVVPKLKAKDESVEPEQNVSRLVQSREAAYFPCPDTEEYRNGQAKRDAILDWQTAFFDKLAAKQKARSAESKQSVAPPKPRKASYYPQREDVDSLRKYAKQEEVVAKQRASSDKMLAAPKTKKGEKSPVIQKLVIPKNSSKPPASEVPDRVLPLNIPCNDLDLVSQEPPCLNAVDSSNLLVAGVDCINSESDHLNYHASPEPMDNYFYIPAPQPFNVPFVSSGTTFYGPGYLDFNYSPISSVADFYFPAPQPGNMLYAGMDKTFSPPGYFNYHDSTRHLAVDFYIPPPTPCIVPSASAYQTFCNYEDLNSNHSMASATYDDDFYIEPPHPKIPRPVSEI